jgi:hypothetical protein
MSVPPPGANGEINLTGLIGYFWPSTGVTVTHNPNEMAAKTALCICSSGSRF